MLRTITIALALAVAFAVVTPAAAAALPSVQAVQAVQAGGLNWWRVTFSTGVVCDVERPLTETLVGSQPASGPVAAFNDGRVFVMGARMWGALTFTDARGTARTCY